MSANGEHESGATPPDTRPFELQGKRLWITRLGYLVIRLINLTIRWRLVDPHGVADRVVGKQVIFCAWHNRLALALPLWYRYRKSRTPSARIAAIASASKDGAIVAGILTRFGAQPVRGSSSRRGVHAMIEMVKWGRKGFDLAVTPDGPRGPKYSLHPGVVSLAQMTRLPILPVSYGLSWKIQMKSWDNFQIPLPFTKCTVELGDLIELERELKDRDAAVNTLRETLLRLTKD